MPPLVEVEDGPTPETVAITVTLTMDEASWLIR